GWLLAVRLAHDASPLGASAILRRRADRPRQGGPWPARLFSRPVQPPSAFVERIDRPVMAYPIRKHDGSGLVVEDVRPAVEEGDQNGMLGAQVPVVDDDDPQILVAPSQRTKRHELGDRVVLAITVLAEELQRRGPIVLDAPVARIDDVAVLVHVAVHRLELPLRVEKGLSVEKGLPFEQVAAVEAAGTALGLDLPVLEIALERAAPFR